MGKPYPEYYAYNDAVCLTIKSATDDLSFVKFIIQEQESRQTIFSLSELMILRFLNDNKRISLSEAQKLTQTSLEETRRSLSILSHKGLLENIGKEYMLTARVYEAIKTDVKYTQDQIVQYIKAKNRILDYLSRNSFITNETVRELCGYTQKQARKTIEKMREENILTITGKGRTTKYILVSKK